MMLFVMGIVFHGMQKIAKHYDLVEYAEAPTRCCNNGIGTGKEGMTGVVSLPSGITPPPITTTTTRMMSTTTTTAAVLH